MIATRASGEDGVGHDLAALLARAARVCVERWTPELRAVAATAPLVRCVLGRGAIVYVRDLNRTRGPLVAVTLGCIAHTHVFFDLALVHVEGEPCPRWIAAERLSAKALAEIDAPSRSVTRKATSRS